LGYPLLVQVNSKDTTSDRRKKIQFEPSSKHSYMVGMNSMPLYPMWSFEKFFTYHLRLSYKINKWLGCDIPLWKAETSQIIEGIDIRQKLFSRDIRHENTETTSGFPLRRTLGNCHKDAKVGDTVATVLGCKHPVLLHKQGDKYEVTDGLYLYGYMDGEAIGKYSEVDIELI
jgi:hypothetical protein